MVLVINAVCCAFPPAFIEDCDIEKEMKVAIAAAIGRIHLSGCAKSLIHKKLSCVAKIMSPEVMYAIGFLSKAKRPMITTI